MNMPSGILVLYFIHPPHHAMGVKSNRMAGRPLPHPFRGRRLIHLGKDVFTPAIPQTIGM